MLTSLLLIMESAEQAAPVIRFGVSLAASVSARIRGLTLVDTRDVEDAQHCEAAVFLKTALTRQALAERRHDRARAELSRVCLEARLNFDVRRLEGDPLDILPQEARCHDLVVTSIGPVDRRLPAGATMRLSMRDLTALLNRGVQPLMVLPSDQEAIKRVLLVYDGSETAGRTIRSYFSLGILRDGEHRLLAIGRDGSAAQSALKEMANYCQVRCPSLEIGFAVGRARSVLAAYAAKWQSDLLVMGVSRSYRLLHPLLGHLSLEMSNALKCGLFVQM